MLLTLFKYEKKVSTASVLSFTVLTYQFSDRFLIVSGAYEAGATNLLLEKKNDSLYFFTIRVENELRQPSFEYFVILLGQIPF